MFAAAGLLCVGAGVGVGRLPALNQLIKAAPVSAASSQANQHRGVPVQGVTVHGWWTIKVFDRNRLLSERQFENALVTGSNDSGDVVIARLLTRQSPMGPWLLSAFDAGGGTRLFQLSNAADHAVQGPLAVSGFASGHVILSGTYTAAANISIGTVATQVSQCQSPTTSPDACVNYFGSYIFSFTSATLGSPVAVSNGQIVQIKVDISFS
jgi:hypothetical protein